MNMNTSGWLDNDVITLANTPQVRFCHHLLEPTNACGTGAVWNRSPVALSPTGRSQVALGTCKITAEAFEELMP